ncbi:hypothetical protein [Kosakonia phage Kc304]|nr:hypothetical protein [Kosakonia phage Kc304]
MLMTEKIVYKWTNAGKERMMNRGTSFVEAWNRLIGFGEFEVAELDKDRNIIAVRTDKGIFKAGEGEFYEVWCMFLQSEIPEKFELIEPEKKEFWTLTIPVNKGMQPFAHGPFDEQAAKDFAVKQIKNAIEGVRVLVLEKSAEAFATYEVK